MAELMFFTEDFFERTTPVDFSDLPERCCAKCAHWTRCKNKPYGACIENSNAEWDAYSYADDLCGSFVSDEEEDPNSFWLN